MNRNVTMANHPNRATRIHPNTTLPDELRSSGVDCQIMWEIPGPKDTLIAWLSCYQVGKSVCIVQTFKDGNGWNAFTPPLTNHIPETVSDVIVRCGVREFQ